MISPYSWRELSPRSTPTFYPLGTWPPFELLFTLAPSFMPVDLQSFCSFILIPLLVLADVYRDATPLSFRIWNAQSPNSHSVFGWQECCSAIQIYVARIVEWERQLGWWLWANWWRLSFKVYLRVWAVCGGTSPRWVLGEGAVSPRSTLQACMTCGWSSSKVYGL